MSDVIILPINRIPPIAIAMTCHSRILEDPTNVSRGALVAANVSALLLRMLHSP